MSFQVHLNLHFDVRTGVPVFIRAGIYGEDANNLTTDLSGRECCVTAMSAEGATFGEARAALLVDLEISPFYNRWIWGHLPNEVPIR